MCRSFLNCVQLLVVAAVLVDGAAAAGPPAQSRPGGLAPRQPQWPLKSGPTLFSNEQVARIRRRCETDAAARAIRAKIIEDAACWVAKSDQELHELLPDSRVPRAFNVSTADCPLHGKEIYRFGTYPWKLDREQPFTVICPIDGARYPSNDFAAFYRGGMTDRSLLTGPYADDGRGWVSPSGEKYWLVAYACHWNWVNTWEPALTALSRAWLLTGDVRYARKAVVMLDRIAEVYPGMDHATQSRYGELMKGNYPGKIQNHIWETTLIESFAIAYDLVFDALLGPDAVSLPWRSAQQIRANIEANLLEEGIDSVADGKIRGNFGMHQSTLAHLVRIRQNGPSRELLTGIFEHTGGEAGMEGIDYALYNLVYKDGMPYETSPGYCFGWVHHLVDMAEALQGSELDLYARPKARLLFDAPIDLICAGRFTPALGDAGSPDAGYVGVSAGAYEAAYRRYQDPRYAWLMGRLGGLKSEQPTRFEDLVEEPVFEKARQAAQSYVAKPASRVLDGYGMVILNNVRDSLAAAMYYGPRGGHGHFDRLNLELFGHDRRLSPDLGYPDFMNAFVSGIYTWSKNTVSHNCLVVDRQVQTGNTPGQVLRFHSGDGVWLVDVDALGSYGQTSVYRRTLMLVETGPDDGYLVDVFRVRGGKEHVLSVHGQEGEFSFQGAELPPPVTQGTLAGADVEYGEIYDDPVRGKAGFAGSFGGYTGSGYQHFFNWQAVRPQASVTGSWQAKGGEPGQLRVHIPPHPEQELTVADAYVSPTRKVPTVLKYLLVRRPGAEQGNTFVSVWEMAGAKPIIDRIEQIAVAGAAGSDEVVVLRVHRGQAVDQVVIAPQPQAWTAGEGLTGDVAAALVSGEQSPELRFAAGGSGVTIQGQATAVPPTIRGTIRSADYRQATIEVQADGDLGETARLVGATVRIHREGRSCVYRIIEARSAGRACTLKLGGSDVFTGRVRIDQVDPSSATIKTATSVLWPANLAGMHLLSKDLQHSAVIASAAKGSIRLAAGSDLGPFVPGEPAMVSDFGPGDQIEIESSISSPPAADK